MKLEKITNLYPHWKPSDLAFIKTIEWSLSNLTVVVYSQSRTNTTGWPDMSNEFFEITFCFKNVSNLKLDFKNGYLQQILGFNIIDISQNQWEGICYQIEDYENEVINFYCKDIGVTKITNPYKILQ